MLTSRRVLALGALLALAGTACGASTQVERQVQARDAAAARAGSAGGISPGSLSGTGGGVSPAAQTTGGALPATGGSTPAAASLGSVTGTGGGTKAVTTGGGS